MRRAVAALVLALGIPACALTPDYERPELGLPSEWLRTSDARSSIANLSWWDVYDDETLSALIELALERNQDLALALARMREARALVTFTRADQFPFLDVFGGVGRGRQSQEINPRATTDNNFSVGANLSFEVDLWQRLARATEAARSDLLASEAGTRNVTISLVADVASTYFLLQDLDNRRDISIRTVEGRQDRVDLIRARFEKGTEPAIDVYQAEVQLTIAQASVVQFERAIAQTEHALRVLVGGYPGRIPRGVFLSLDRVPIEIPIGLPSELLERRPDIVEAEQRLSAETARVGVAQALRFPSLSLTAEVGAIATDLTDLNSTDAGQWSILANVFQPLFNSGQLKAQAKAQQARAEQTLHFYIATLQNAFREVEDALVAVDTFRREYAIRVRQVEAARNALRLSKARYDGGVVDYLEVLDSERNLFDAELDASLIRQSTLTSFATLYKALGGGWDERVMGDEGGEDQEAGTRAGGGAPRERRLPITRTVSHQSSPAPAATRTSPAGIDRP